MRISCSTRTTAIRRITSVCRTWPEQSFNGSEPVALPWQTLLASIRIATNPRISSHPLAAQQACGIVGRWLEHPNVTVVGPADRFWGILREQLLDAQVSGPMVTDAALAALAFEHGAAMCSTDRDFRRFRGLKLVDPLKGHQG